MKVLNAREKRIFEARRLAEEPMTLEDLAAEFGVSRERVRQIEVRAFEKVQAAAKAQVAAQAAASRQDRRRPRGCEVNGRKPLTAVKQTRFESRPFGRLFVWIWPLLLPALAEFRSVGTVHPC